MANKLAEDVGAGRNGWQSVKELAKAACIVFTGRVFRQRKRRPVNRLEGGCLAEVDAVK